jgi:outer membrane cobalamin receptor
MIDYSGDTSACGFSYCNVARARANGAELELRGRVIPSIDASVGATVLRTRVLDPGFDTSSAGLYRRGESLVRRPGRSVATQLTWHPSRLPLSASARLQLVGSRTDRDYSSFTTVPVTLPAYQRLDVAGEYALPLQSHRAALSLRVENALNAHYETVFNFLAPRRTITLGVRTTL